jgi:hypothetical protein
MEDLNDKVTGGTLSAAEWNQVPSEIQNVIEALGITLVNTDLNQLNKAISGMVTAGDFYVDTGVADAYVVDPIGGKIGPAALDSIHDGMLIRFLPGNNSTGASTINVNELGIKTLTREGGGAIQAGDLSTTHDAYVRYDQAADDFLLQNFAISEALDVPRGYIDGLITSHGADAVNDISFAAGICRDSTNAETMQNSSAFVKQIDVNWAAGTNNGGFPSLLTLTNGVWYHMFIIKNTSTGAVDFGFDSNLSATNLLTDATGYTVFRRIGSVFRLAGTNVQYQQFGDQFVWDVAVEDTDLTDPGSSQISHTVTSVPLGVEVLADVSILFFRPTGSAVTYYRAGIGGSTLAAPAIDDRDTTTSGQNAHTEINKLIRTNTVRQIETRQSASGASSKLRILTHGWTDQRGRDS